MAWHGCGVSKGDEIEQFFFACVDPSLSLSGGWEDVNWEVNGDGEK